MRHFHYKISSENPGSERVCRSWIDRNISIKFNALSMWNRFDKSQQGPIINIAIIETHCIFQWYKLKDITWYWYYIHYFQLPLSQQFTELGRNGVIGQVVRKRVIKVRNPDIERAPILRLRMGALLVRILESVKQSAAINIFAQVYKSLTNRLWDFIAIGCRFDW